VAAILLAFTTGGEYSLTEHARQARLPVSTTHRLASELVAWGTLERSEDGTYRPGGHLQPIGDQPPLLPATIREKANRVMSDLATATCRAAVRLGLLHDGAVVYVEKVASERPVTMFYEAATAPAHASAMGKALLAFAARETVGDVIRRGLPRYTPHTLTTREQLQRALAVTRLTRVGVCRRELEPCTYAVGAPVFGPGGAAVAALEIQTRNPQDIRRVQPALVMAASALSWELVDRTGGPRADQRPARHLRAVAT